VDEACAMGECFELRFEGWLYQVRDSHDPVSVSTVPAGDFGILS
jgi:hypothetical protein